MSEISDMIQRLCPDGVEYRKLGEVCDRIFAGGTPSTSNKSYYDGDIPWIRSGEVNFNVIRTAERNITQEGLDNSSAKWIKRNSVVIAMTGATVAKSAVVEFETTANQSVAALEPSNKLDYKFLYYYVSGHYQQIKGMAQGALTSINLQIIKDLEIPVPPIEVQRKIVEVLDNFSELAAELAAELEARKKQYEYYRDNLLNFNRGGQVVSNVKWMKLGEICNVFTGGEVPMNTAKGQLEPSMQYPYPVYTNGKDVYGYTDSYQIDCDAVCVSSIGANTGDVFYRNAFFTPAIRLKVIVPKIDYLNTKFLFYITSVIDFSGKNKGSVPNINAEFVKRILIPIPPLSEQERIVSILDRFEAMTTDLTAGLPAEIKARQQQYEYYRDQLLTFKRAN